MKVGKILFAIFYSLFVLAVILVDGWYIYVKVFGAEKFVINTYDVGLQTLEDGTTRSFVEVKYHSNENKNGLECLDINFNYLQDESKNAFYSQGIQFVANSENDTIDWGYCVDKNAGYIVDHQGAWYNFKNCITTYGYFGSYDINRDKANAFNYASNDQYKSTAESTNPITDDTLFRIQLDNEIYAMKFQGKDGMNKYGGDDGRKDSNGEIILDTKRMPPEEYLYGTETIGTNILGNKSVNAYYVYQNINNFSYKLYQVAKTLKPGTASSKVFEFGDMFDYYKYDEESKQYSNEAIRNIETILQKFLSYYSIRFEVVSDGIQRASDSLFNCVQGNSGFNLLGDYKEENGYDVGRTILECGLYDNVNDFVFVNVVDNYYCLKFKDEFVKNFSHYDTVYLSIKIDLDKFDELRYKFIGFTNDSGLEKFKIFECYTVHTVNGEIERAEVKI